MSKPRDDNSSCRVFVGNLDFNADKTALRTLFKLAGTVADVYTPFDKTKEGFKNRGFAFVEMSSPSEAAKAIELFNGMLGPGGRVLTVKPAKSRS